MSCRNLKLGVHTDSTKHAKLAKHLHYHSTKGGNLMTSLDDYVIRMDNKQPNIYSITGESKRSVGSLPSLEKLDGEGYAEVEIMSKIAGDRVGAPWIYSSRLRVPDYCGAAARVVTLPAAERNPSSFAPFSSYARGDNCGPASSDPKEKPFITLHMESILSGYSTFFSGPAGSGESHIFSMPLISNEIGIASSN